jgi:hypothetical protein
VSSKFPCNNQYNTLLEKIQMMQQLSKELVSLVSLVLMTCDNEDMFLLTLDIHQNKIYPFRISNRFFFQLRFVYQRE